MYPRRVVGRARGRQAPARRRAPCGFAPALRAAPRLLATTRAQALGVAAIVVAAAAAAAWGAPARPLWPRRAPAAGCPSPHWRGAPKTPTRAFRRLPRVCVRRARRAPAPLPALCWAGPGAKLPLQRARPSRWPAAPRIYMHARAHAHACVPWPPATIGASPARRAPAACRARGAGRRGRAPPFARRPRPRARRGARRRC
ncbi:MAG: hypothetical protein J3K34DRAFT_413011 [Monoraphidium minutum]|nr:MAG: hypothetical protein J3K34DRAFT_413011 [Monoraphidium minutum]